MATSPSTKHETLSSLQAQLAFLSGEDPVLSRMIRDKLPLTASTYIDINWNGEPPEMPEPEDQLVIDTLKAYEAAQKH